MGTATQALAKATTPTRHLTYTLWVPLMSGAVIRWRQVIAARGFEQCAGTRVDVARDPASSGAFVTGYVQPTR